MILVGSAAGCGTPKPQFEPNLAFMRYQKLAESRADFDDPELREQIDDIEHAVQWLFGTPDAPKLPEFDATELNHFLDLDRLKRSAGPVGGDLAEQTGGLYRQHCARCHGINGSGTGLMAGLLKPYPRDFRRGVFKFKRTSSQVPPTRQDMMRTIERGIPGTAMPSFAELSEEDRLALVQYVQYLSIRGELERFLIVEVAMELDEGERLVSWATREQNPDRFEEEVGWLREVASEPMRRWAEAASHVTHVPEPPEDWRSETSVSRGKALFFTTLTNCAACHGDTALGDGQTDDYGDWAKEFEPGKPAALRDYLALGALPPYKSQPRNLRLGVYRGGEDR